MHTRRILYTLTKQDPGNEGRHLLIHLVDGSRKMILSQLTAAGHTEIDKGTEYQMNQKANALAQDWIDKEGFRFPPEGIPVFEAFKQTIELATLMGYTHVYDDRYKKGLNLTGKVLLTSWPGMAPQNGGDCEYALDGMTIIARPPMGPSVTYLLHEE